MFIKLKDSLLGAGLDGADSTFDFHIKSMFNVINTILLVSLHLCIINEVIRANPKGVLIAGGFTLTLLLIHWLNFKGKFQISSVIFCSVFPLGIGLLCIAYSGVRFMDFYFATFVLALMLFMRNLGVRMILGLCYLALYIGIKYHHAHYPALLGFELDIATNAALVTVFVLIFWVLSYLLMIRLKESYAVKDELVANLQIETEALAKANDELEKLVALASHDLKSPLRTISNYAGLVKMKNKDEGLNTYLDVIGDSSKHMINLIDQTITYGQMDVKSEPIQVLDLNAIVDKVRQQIGDAFGSYEIERENLSIISSKEMAVYKVVQNIIENGLKYNQSPSKKIVISQSQDHQNHYLKIKDNGIGIEKGDHNKIFAMYSRLHGNATYEGTGIGLAICKKAINKLGGDIVLNSKVGEGSTFTIIFPKEVVEQESSSTETVSISTRPAYSKQS